LKKAIRIIEELQSKSIYCVMIALVVLVVDYYTGEYILFPILYILPVGIAAWSNKKTIAY